MSIILAKQLNFEVKNKFENLYELKFFVKIQ